MKFKKIFISVTNDISFDQRMLKTAHTLSKNGFEVTIIGRKINKEYLELDKMIQIHRFNLICNKGKFFYIEYNIRLFFYLLFHSFDILCAVDLDTILPNVLVSKLKQKKVIYDAHEYFTEVPELVGRKFEKKIWKWVESYCVPKCFAIYTVGPKIAQIFENEYNMKCEVIYNFPFKVDNIKKVPSNPPIVLYQGDLNKGRGLESAIKAVKKLPVQFWIAGDGPIKSELEYLVTVEKLEDKVIFLGKISPVELLRITQQASIGLNLLENKGLNYYYSLANKFFDFIQNKIPSINMNFPEYQEIVNQYHCAYLIDDIEVKTIENAINHLLSDEKLYEELRNNCDIARSKLHWEIQEEKLCSIYHND